MAARLREKAAGQRGVAVATVVGVVELYKEFPFRTRTPGSLDVATVGNCAEWLWLAVAQRTAQHFRVGLRLLMHMEWLWLHVASLGHVMLLPDLSCLLQHWAHRFQDSNMRFSSQEHRSLKNLSQIQDLQGHFLAGSLDTKHHSALVSSDHTN
uniref:Uncharacterized protein n=1 Tax=Cryptomonas curvata TaxID=233186 RepID=A0A7S0MCT5_9CRYP